MDIENLKDKIKTKTNLLPLIGIFLVLILVGFGVYKLRPSFLSKTQVKNKLNKLFELTAGKGTIEIKNIENSKDSNLLYDVTVATKDGRSMDYKVTKDGKFILVAPLQENIDDLIDRYTPVKSDKPVIELFVMSYCPFGTQMEKAILPVIELLKDKVDFRLKFVSYVMHGDDEIQENLRQHCIIMKNPEKLDPYLNCFLKSKNAYSCLSSVSLDAKEIDQCMKEEDEKYKISENVEAHPENKFPAFPIDDADNKKYGVMGSPTLVINGKVIDQAPRNSKELLDVICSYFNNPPEECSKGDSLSSENAMPGFDVDNKNLDKNIQAPSSGTCN